MIAVNRFVPMAEELDSFFSSFDPQAEYLHGLLDEMYDRYADASSFRQKMEQIRILAEKSDIHVFRHFPFWAQLSAGRPRYIWGGLDTADGGGYLHFRKAAELEKHYFEVLAPDRAAGRLHNWANPTGHDHHCLNYDDILALGLHGLKEKAVAGLGVHPEAKEFYDAMLETLCILEALSLRFSREAERLLETETDPAARRNLSRIASSAARVPAQPAKTFYEALASIFFCREVVGTLEGIGISTFGQLDRMLLPYYERDLASGRITRQEALDLLESLFVYTSVRFSENTTMRETSTTMILGGCDREGNTVYNEVTRMILEAELEGRYVNTKLDCRVSGAHPKEYFLRLADIQLSGLAVFVMMNDEVHIPARVRLGQDVEDVRLYAAGGCHEIVLGGSEVCTRADTWLGLPAILLDTLRKKEYASYEELYAEAIADVEAFHRHIEAEKNEVEKHWWEYNPMPLYSAFLTGCAQSGKDATQGGSKYASTALSMVGPADFVDSLWALKTLIYEEKKLTQQEFISILDRNFEGSEPLRQYILNRMPKFAMGSDILDDFSARVLHDLSHVSGRENGRGGKYLPAFYAHDIYRPLGFRTGATPNGRLRGVTLSRGVSPCEFIPGHTPTEIIRSMKKLDFTDFADSFVLELTLPKLDKADGAEILTALMEEFIDAGGSSLQFNLLEPEKLLEARRDPSLHRDMIVRVCGYSDYFVNLVPEIQDEVITRALREA